ncbi:MAG: DUF3810 domain-containing protein [Intestinibacter sp.]|uniref:DUF3810 domain-containing protein n=1 Tax=Intestinibacter sp. TaxID=1965304 RepID=UPI003F171DD2
MKKFRKICYILFIISIFIKYISTKYSYFVENYYSRGIDVYIVKLLSKVSSIFDFSCFEIMIYLLSVSVVLSIMYLIYRAFKGRSVFFKSFKNILLNYLACACLIYSLFILLWGVNYNRVSLEDSIKEEYNESNYRDISKLSFDQDDLANLYEILIQKCNESKQIVDSSNSELENNSSDIKNIISELEEGYDDVELLNLNELGGYSKAKIILSSKWFSYTNITGIYSPFTGEANINTNQPLISIPFTVLHEMAHQRGYGNESDANFLSYIACIENKNPYVNYSGYFMALRYTASALSKVDYNEFVSLTKNIDDEVLKDINDYSEFWEKYEGKINEVSDNVNNIYLKSNRIKEGTKSYGKVVDLLLLYYYLYG